MKFLLPIILPLSMFASNILSYNIYDRTDRVDVMITFDTPYSGKIKQTLSDSKIIIKLEEAKIESSKVKQLSTNFLQSLSITPMSEYTQIVATVPSTVHLIASKTSDAYGLRLRFTKSTQKKEIQKEPNNLSKNFKSTLPTKKDEDISQSYYIVIVILFIGIIILLIFKRKINQNEDSKSWLFSNHTPKKANSKKVVGVEGMNEISIKFQKDINSSNSVILIDFQDQSYLVLMGSNNNILLDKFSENKPTTQEDFESIISSKSQELDEFLKVGNNNKNSEPLQAYKERAASLIYGDDN